MSKKRSCAVGSIPEASYFLVAAVVGSICAGPGLIAGCQHGAFANENKDPSRQGLISCDTPHVDFGTIYIPSEPIRHDFAIRSTCDIPLQLAVTGKSCSCTRTTLSKTQLRPGDICTLSIVWRAPEHPGLHSFTVSISAKPSEDKEATVSIELTGRASVRERIAVSPRRLDFGRLRPGEQKTISVVLQAGSGDKLALGTVSILGSERSGVRPIEVALHYTGSDRARLNLTIRGVAGLGKRRYFVRIPTRSPTQGTLTIEVDAHHLARFVAEPDALLFVRPSAQTICSVTFEDSEGKPLQTDRVVVADCPVQHTATEQVRPSKVRLRFAVAGTLNTSTTSVGEIRVYFDSITEPVRIPCVVIP